MNHRDEPQKAPEPETLTEDSGVCLHCGNRRVVSWGTDDVPCQACTDELPAVEEPDELDEQDPGDPEGT